MSQKHAKQDSKNLKLRNREYVTINSLITMRAKMLQQH